MKILSLLCLMLLVSCRYETEEVTVSCLEKMSKYGYTNYDQGAESGSQKLRITYKISTNWITGKESRHVEDFRGLSGCSLTCKPNHSKYSNLSSSYNSLSIYYGHPAPDSVCIPAPDECKKVQMNNQNAYSSYSNALNTYSYIDDPSCSASCAEGFSVDNSTEENSCVETEVNCSEEELGTGGLEGTKTWNEETDSYNSCLITACNEGYELNENQCQLVEVVSVPGCMASGALNYNPQATEDDGSCVCDDGFAYNSEQGVCLPSEMSCDEGQYYNPMTLMCEPEPT